MEAAAFITVLFATILAAAFLLRAVGIGSWSFSYCRKPGDLPKHLVVAVFVGGRLLRLKLTPKEVSDAERRALEDTFSD